MPAESFGCLAHGGTGLGLLHRRACLLVSLGYFYKVNLLHRFSLYPYIIGHNIL